jgi:hypothetical protein
MSSIKKISGIGFGLMLLLWSCNSAKITTAWKAPAVEPTKYKKILVLAIISEKDRQVQERMEQHFVGDLANMGYTAISALQLYGPRAFDSVKEMAAIAKIKSSGADAVITIVLLNMDKERTYVPERTYTLNMLGGYYGQHYQRIYEPGYYTTTTKYLWESNFYDLSTQQLLYSVQSKSFSPGSIESMSHQYGQLLVANMRKNHVLQNMVPLTPQH